MLRTAVEYGEGMLDKGATSDDDLNERNGKLGMRNKLLHIVMY